MSRPRIVQHSFGSPGSGGPIGALQRLQDSPLADKYEFLSLQQDRPFGGIDVGIIRRWTAWLRDQQPDMIHVRGLGNEGFHAAVAARSAGVPRILVSVHGTQRDLKSLTGIQRLRVGVVSHVLEPVTLTLATDVATVCNYAARRSFVVRHRHKFVGVVPNGVRVPAIAPDDRLVIRGELGIASQSLVLAVVGRLSTEKGLDTLAEALSIDPHDPTSHSPVHLIIVGDGPERQRLQDRFAGCGWAKTHFLGQRHDVASILNATDVFVFPTLHENLSNALLEALAAGLPTVASAVGGNIEVLDGGVGILVPPSDPNSLRTALTTLLNRPELRAELVERRG